MHRIGEENYNYWLSLKTNALTLISNQHLHKLHFSSQVSLQFFFSTLSSSSLFSIFLSQLQRLLYSTLDSKL